MNRMEEFCELTLELEKDIPEMTNSIEKAYKRKQRRDLVYRPLMSVLTFIFVFIFLVNISSTVAYACSQVPILKELVEAVTFSKSLSSAVENNYVQPMNLIQKDGDITATIEYLIVDQKQVNVFYRLDSKQYEFMDCEPKVKGEYSSYYMSNYETERGELSCLTIDFGDKIVPDILQVELKVRDSKAYDPETGEGDFVSHFAFALQFDPRFTAEGKNIEVNREVILEEQKITITDMEIYPTHMRVNVKSDETNTAWLKRLEFYFVLDEKIQFDAASEGIVSTGKTGSPEMVSFRADSTYFYNAEKIELVITGAEWLQKNREKIYVNLENGETDPLPEGVELYSTFETSNGWELKLKVKERKENEVYAIFNMNYYDAEGVLYELNSVEWHDSEEEGYYIEGVTFEGYHGKEVWFGSNYSHRWEAKEPIILEVR